MSEANIRFSLLPNSLSDTKFVDSSVNQTSISEETEVYSTNDRQTEIPRHRGPMTWEDRLREIGREFAEIRTAQGISVYQLHAQTLVPLHTIQALEKGDFKRLPEKIYVQGFVRRIGDYLGFDGAKLADSLPPDEAIAPVSQRNHFWTFQGFYFTRFHLYLSYIALLIAAVSALSAISNPSPQESSAQKFINPVTDAETPASEPSGAKKSGTETSGAEKPSTIKK